MKTTFKRIGLLIILIAISAALAVAHQGRTDSRGGHKDNKNKSGLGSYHSHCGGYPAHLHTGGVCPYNKPKQTTTKPKPTNTQQPKPAPKSK